VAQKAVRLSRYNHTYRVQIGRYVEAFDGEHMERYAIIDRIRWICITYGGNFSETTVAELLRDTQEEHPR
jgi:CRISPR/Cas system CSM-associated protein Csm5 (group 7 of RAMP superfamily)